MAFTGCSLHVLKNASHLFSIWYTTGDLSSSTVDYNMHSALVIAQKFCDLATEKHKQDSTPYSITFLKLMKLLYITHGHKLAIKQMPLFSDTIEAWKYGPVVPSLYYVLKRHQPDEYMVPSIPGIGPEDVGSLTNDDVEIIELVFDRYYKYSAGQLVSITHNKESPWYKIYDRLESPMIPDEETQKYYVALLAKARREKQDN